MDMTGILLYGADAEGNAVGPFWHTTNTREGRPLGLIKWRPDEVRGFPFGNHSDGGIDVELLLTVHVVALFWQYAPSEFPPSLVMNLYFREFQKLSQNVQAGSLYHRVSLADQAESGGIGILPVPTGRL
jgi:hypothetical protein